MEERQDDHGRTQAFTKDIMRKLRGEDRRGMSPAFIGVALSALGALAGMVVFALSFGKDLGAQQQRIETIEKRQIEDREVGSHKLNKLENKVEKIDGNVNLILQEIRAMQAEQRARERERREDR